jgi:hypothetical protein
MQVQMKTSLLKDNLGIILTLESLSDRGEQSPLSAQLILNRSLVDDDGNICLSPSVGFQDALDIIDTLKSELDILAGETVLWFARNIELRHAHTSIILNGSGGNAGRDSSGGRGCASGSTSQPPQLRLVSPARRP